MRFEEWRHIRCQTVRCQTGSAPCGVCSTCGEQHGAGRFWGFAQNDRGLRFEERDLRGATSGGLSWLEGQHCGGEGGGFEVLGMGRIEV